MENSEFDREAILKQVSQAVADGKITAGAEENIRAWLTEPRYTKYAGEVAQHVADEKWQKLDDVFWTIIPFGTGGRRGRMYSIGSNAINERTIGESAQGLADYVKEHASGPLSCAIAFDTRHRSVEFSKLCASIMVAAGFKVYYLDEIRSTPELSFAVRYKQCRCGIMVTASHNPPSDNAVKAYWSTGGQILPPHDKGVIDRVMNVENIEVADFDQAVADGNIELCKDDVDQAFFAELRQQAFPGPRDVKVIYSPLHGVGGYAALPALEQDGFADVELFGPHAEPNGDFPNVPDHVSNPENKAVFDAMIERAKEISADVVLATDPDCDRVGCGAPVTSDVQGEWKTFTGNQIGALLGDYVFGKRKERGDLTPEHYLVTTLVTTRLVGRIAKSYGCQSLDNHLVGFKWIGGAMDEHGPDKFVFGTEESHGYLVGQYARDKDGAVATMLMAELAADCKSKGESLHDRLDTLYNRHGYHAERLVTQKMEGSEGMALMKKLMQQFRTSPPTALAGLPVKQVRDYGANQIIAADQSTTPLDGPTGDLVIMDLAEEGNYVAARPSGTEPKVKFYMFTYVSADDFDDLANVKEAMELRLDGMQKDLEAFASSVS